MRRKRRANPSTSAGACRPPSGKRENARSPRPNAIEIRIRNAAVFSRSGPSEQTATQATACAAPIPPSSHSRFRIGSIYCNHHRNSRRFWAIRQWSGGRGTCYPASPDANYDSRAPQKFTGKERDAETGLDYFGARYCSAAQGRFLSADLPLIAQKVDLPQSWNLYSNVRKNPLILPGFAVYPTYASFS
ncbi:MAG: hypothetical protein JXP48_04060 [Acidobacteria bacterium]|nr:hypothetical protein [Acidobacteriota bacterium]